MTREYIKGFGGKKIGFIQNDENGNKSIFDFYGHKLGYYDKRTDTTRDFYGRIVAHGEQLGMFYDKLTK